MVQIDNLSDASDQVTQIQMPDGTVGTLELFFLGAINRWSFNFTHPQFPAGALKGQMLCDHPNILRNFKNILDFGMACDSGTGTGPTDIEAFASGRCSLFLLDAEDVAAVELGIYGIAT